LLKGPDFSDLDLNISHARIALGLVALLSIYIDPSTGGLFGIAPGQLAVVLGYLLYAVAVYLFITRRLLPGRLPLITTGLDIAFATALAFFTEGPTSPSYMFFTFAIIAAGCRFPFRATSIVTLCCVAVYLAVILFADPAQKHFHLMRPAYLAVTGYLIAFLSQQRANFEARIRKLETSAERERIARSLHDGYVQELASLNLRLGACRELLLRDRQPEALAQVTELKSNVAREYDKVRSYIRSLVNMETVEESKFGDLDTLFHIDITFKARGLIIEQIFQMMLEGIRNVWRHGKAASAKVRIAQTADVIKIVIDDNGRGFRQTDSIPWAIASRVAEFGGQVTIRGHGQVGAHLEIEMPTR